MHVFFANSVAVCALLLATCAAASQTKRGDYTNFRLYFVHNVTDEERMDFFDEWAARRANDVSMPWEV